MIPKEVRAETYAWFQMHGKAIAIVLLTDYYVINDGLIRELLKEFYADDPDMPAHGDAPFSAQACIEYYYQLKGGKQHDTHADRQ